MNNTQAAAIIKVLGKRAIDAGLLPSVDILDTCVLAVQALMPWKATIEQRPLFGHISGKKSNTHWMTFIKLPEEKK